LEAAAQGIQAFDDDALSKGAPLEEGCLGEDYVFGRSLQLRDFYFSLGKKGNPRSLQLK